MQPGGVNYYLTIKLRFLQKSKQKLSLFKKPQCDTFTNMCLAMTIIIHSYEAGVNLLLSVNLCLTAIEIAVSRRQEDGLCTRKSLNRKNV